MYSIWKINGLYSSACLSTLEYYLQMPYIIYFSELKGQTFTQLNAGMFNESVTSM